MGVPLPLPIASVIVISHVHLQLYAHTCTHMTCSVSCLLTTATGFANTPLPDAHQATGKKELVPLEA